jgi:hypothetical protein
VRRYIRGGSAVSARRSRITQDGTGNIVGGIGTGTLLGRSGAGIVAWTDAANILAWAGYIRARCSREHRA